MNIFVGKLDFSTQDPSLKATFEKFGEVSAANIIIDHFTGKSRGFGFVEMPNEEEALAAIEALNDTTFEGQVIIVKEAEERKKGSTFRSSYDMHYNSKGDRVPEEERERQRMEQEKERRQNRDRNDRGGYGGGRRGGGYGGGGGRW
ncbi:MAG: RNA-binding protein [Saprospiraceae bacterium]|nr:RNA-binding protein [Saprospiraceae bacterium]